MAMIFNTLYSQFEVFICVNGNQSKLFHGGVGLLILGKSVFNHLFFS